MLTIHPAARWLRRVVLAFGLLVVAGSLPPSPVGAATITSCTETGLEAALAAGGTISFNCGPSPVTIPITRVKEVVGNTVIDGGGLVTLDGGGRTRIFYLNKYEVNNGMTFALRNITLRAGISGGVDPTHGGCIYARRSAVELTNVTLAACQGQGGGGYFAYGGSVEVSGGRFTGNLANHGGALQASQGAEVMISGTTFDGNAARGDGGAIYIFGARLAVRGSTFSGNKARAEIAGSGHGGAIYTLETSAPSTVDDSVFGGNTAERGGGIFADKATALTVRGSRFQGNIVTGQGGALATWKSRVDIADSEFRENQGGLGGAVNNGTESSVSIVRGTFGDNRARRDGGAVYNYLTPLAISDSSFFRNQAGLDNAGDTRGGALVNYRSPVTIVGSTFNDNRVAGPQSFGGAIGTAGTIEVRNSTIVGNSAQRGGGIYANRDTTTLFHVTIAGNAADNGRSLSWESAAAVRVGNSILAGLHGAKNCSQGTLADLGGNLQSGDTTCLPGRPATDPLLGPLGANGGATHTAPLLPGSPAIDAASAGQCLPVDQRGVVRPQGGGCDAGAYEVVARISVGPAAGFIGDPGMLLSVYGEGFGSGSRVLWNGAERPTTFVNGGTLRAAIGASDLSAPGTVTVTVSGSSLPGATLQVLPLGGRARLPAVRR